jgi:hypothetical protein
MEINSENLDGMEENIDRILLLMEILVGLIEQKANPFLILKKFPANPDY